MSTIRLSTAAAIAVFAFLAVGVSPVSAAPIVECGQLSAYTAPDPTGPTAGNLQIGLLPAWEVLATATVSSGAAVTLPSIVNTGPTCLALDFDTDDKITAIDFAPEGQITGNVDYDSGSGFYVFADRLIVPNFITDAYPGLAALFVTSYQAGTVLAVKFTVDTSTGAFVGFDGQADFCGTASLTAGGDAQIGDAVIPSSVLDPDDIADVLGAGDREACAAVHAVGTILPEQNGAIAVTTDVVITVAAPAATPSASTPTTPRPTALPTAPPTSVAPPGGPQGTELTAALAAAILAFAVAAAIAMRRFGAIRE